MQLVMVFCLHPKIPPRRRALLQVGRVRRLLERDCSPANIYQELLRFWRLLTRDAGLDEEIAERMISPLKTAYRKYELTQEIVQWLRLFSVRTPSWPCHYQSLWRSVPLPSTLQRSLIDPLLDRRFHFSPTSSG